MTTRSLLIGLILSAFALTGAGQTDQLKPVEFLIGTWQVEERPQFETWERTDETQLSGQGYQMRGDEKAITETLALRMIDGKLTYEATVANQNEGQTIPFTLTSQADNRLIFENLSHDFPKRIIYQKLSADTLKVEVLGENDRGFAFRMIRQPNK